MNPSNFRRIHNQFSGFLKTPDLFISEKNLEYKQFKLNENVIVQSDLDISIPSNLPLGKRIEHFFLYYLIHFSEEKVLANNIQIKSGKITIGELDFLIQNKLTEVCSHIELVYKFYIYDPVFENEKFALIGPNRKDSLVKKLEKLQNHQFPLLHQPETAQLIDELKINSKEVLQKICFKAFIFIPKVEKIPVFTEINPACIAGYWIRFDTFSEETYGAFQFYLPVKQDWCIEPRLVKQWFSFSEIKKEIIGLFNSEKSPLVWMKNEKDFERFFVVWW
ncbi:MAG TPA: DUF1853 family protein [Salinimicrobium sp.]|nr:DUF1853 family protein [Salinimicrobium sp.]